MSEGRRLPRLVLLDRDGTLNRKPAEGDYVTQVDALELLPGAASAVRRLNDAGIPVAVVTNQRGVALGRIVASELERIHAALVEGLGRGGAHLNAIYHCPHNRGQCHCRKPEPGLLLRAGIDFHVPLEEAVMVGDSDSDVEAGRRAGALTVQLVQPGEPSLADLTAPDLVAAVDLMLSP
ncbi:MAG: D-glycero-D-manno-heptose 1,7-bisphosphate phosphatase [Solirubrobacteraceae bacterium]